MERLLRSSPRFDGTHPKCSAAYPTLPPASRSAHTSSSDRPRPAVARAGIRARAAMRTHAHIPSPRYGGGWAKYSKSRIGTGERAGRLCRPRLGEHERLISLPLSAAPYRSSPCLRPDMRESKGARSPRRGSESRQRGLSPLTGLILPPPSSPPPRQAGQAALRLGGRRGGGGGGGRRCRRRSTA